jgi:hypothetical protein
MSEGKAISPEWAEKMIDQEEKEFNAIVSPDSNPNLKKRLSETKSVWFPKEILEQLLKDRADGSQIDGVRVYFACYPPEMIQEFDELTESDTKVMTVVLANTREVKQEGKIIHKDLLAGRKADKTIAVKDDGTSIYNIGEKCRPVCNGSYYG